MERPCQRGWFAAAEVVAGYRWKSCAFSTLRRPWCWGADGRPVQGPRRVDNGTALSSRLAGLGAGLEGDSGKLPRFSPYVPLVEYRLSAAAA